MSRRFGLRRMSPFRIIMAGFIAVILAGTVLLMLPVSSRSGARTEVGVALFTATSAVCVTGLVVKDTAITWSPFGQAVILLLIQIGGLGIVSLTTAAAAAFSSSGVLPSSFVFITFLLLDGKCSLRESRASRE